MKKNLMIAALALAVLTPAFADITASPKAKEQLDAHKSVATKTTTTSLAACCPGKRAIVASPKLLETMKGPKGCCGNTACIVACTK